MKALIIVDLQNDFLPGGALAVPGGDGIIEVILRIKEVRTAPQSRPNLTHVVGVQQRNDSGPKSVPVLFGFRNSSPGNCR